MKPSTSLCLLFLLACCITVNTPVYVFEEEEDPVAKVLNLIEPPEDLESGHSGFLLGSPVGITSNLSTPADPITIKMAGFTEIDPDAAPPAVPVPDFTQLHTDIFTGGPDEPPILAMSLGLDVIEAQATGPLADLDGGPSPTGVPLVLVQPLRGLGGWAAFEFSVNANETAGVADDQLSHDIGKARADGTLDRTVFSFLLPGDMPSLAIEYESTSAMDPEALGLGTDGDEIHGLNMHMALYATDLVQHAGVFTTRSLPDNPSIYFTLRPEYLAAATTHLPWITHQNSGTIYKARWDPSASRWVDPQKYRTWEELSIPRGPNGAPPVIDGLAIDVSPQGTGAGDEILFSTDGSTAAEDQIRYVVARSTGTASDAPKRVVYYNKRTGGYGTLGKQMKAGRAVGDFCTEDPAVVTQAFSPIQHTDEIFVARRMLPPSRYAEPTLPILRPDRRFPFELPVIFELWPPVVPMLPPWPPEPPQPPFAVQRAAGADPEPPVRTWQAQRPWPKGLKFQKVARLRVAPELDLAVSGFRQLLKNAAGEGVPHMRTCMSWPRPIASSGVAAVRWYEIPFLLSPAAIDLDNPVAEETFLYDGKPLTASRPLPDATPAPSSMRAMVAHWTLVAGGRTYTSHLSVLRY